MAKYDTTLTQRYRENEYRRLKRAADQDNRTLASYVRNAAVKKAKEDSNETE